MDGPSSPVVVPTAEPAANEPNGENKSASKYEVDAANEDNDADDDESDGNAPSKPGSVRPVPSTDDFPQMSLSAHHEPPLKLKFKRQHTFQTRQRRHLKKQVKKIAATSHSMRQFLLVLWRTCGSIHAHERLAFALIELKLLTTGLLVAIGMDIVWLCRHETTSYGGTFPFSILSITRVWVACCMCLKAGFTMSVYWFLEPHEMSTKYPTVASARQLRRLIFQKIGYFFPTTALPPLGDLSRHTLLRVVALLWIHVVSGGVLLVLGLVSCASFTMYPQFRSAALGIPLHYMILVKGGTTLASVMLFVNHLHLPVWRCLRLLHSLQGFKGPLIHWHGIGYGQDSNWIKTLQFAKAADAFCGCYLLLVLYSAFHHGSGFYGGVMAVLTIATILVVLLECWVPLLGLVVYKFVGVMEQAHRDFDSFKLLPRNWNATQSSKDPDEESNDDTNDEGDSSSSSSSSSSDSDDSSADTHKHDGAASATWLRYTDEYNRSYVRNTLTGEMFWDRPDDDSTPSAHELTHPSPSDLGGLKPELALSNTMYMTADDFKYLWNTLPPAGGFLCRILSTPTVDDLTSHLSECRFYVITDGLAAAHIRAVYFYAIHTDTLAHFLGAFLMDSLSMQLEAKFKCDQPDMVAPIVRCLQLRYILGDYEPLGDM
ncbi:hypothetical protein DYB38_002485 [Aphanomyces astaci]|uniref:WW domain-containing protein n=1 Tax=Aphanomyces astaci TaxID=112090 RepID=A0A397B059_APHAT|nr:hypothetical protein DYB36_002073 [Aphanomyces astaci]RHY61748.1 hypothetical protein DYB38_002485 [Aphanomyces astaci]